MNKILKEPVSILIPVCNENDIIDQVMSEWFDTVMQYLPEGSEMIIDDASTDGTEQKLLKWCARHSCLLVQHQNHKDGFFAAACRLYYAARCPLVFFSDSDGQYVPEDFWNSAALIGEYDIVHGYKAHRKDPFYRIFASSGFNLISRMLFGHQFHDINSVHRLARRDIVLKYLPMVRRLPTLLHAEMLLRAYAAGCRIAEVPIQHRPRKYGTSKGLPFRTFAFECVKAYRGLYQLRSETTIR